MKRKLIVVMAAFALLLGAFNFNVSQVYAEGSTTFTGAELNVPDINFRKYIAEEILGRTADVDPNYTIYESDLPVIENVTTINAASRDIESIEGVQYFKKATTLHFENNNIRSVQPLVSTIKRYYYHLDGNQITNFSYCRIFVDAITPIGSSVWGRSQNIKLPTVTLNAGEDYELDSEYLVSFAGTSNGDFSVTMNNDGQHTAYTGGSIKSAKWENITESTTLTMQVKRTTSPTSIDKGEIEVNIEIPVVVNKTQITFDSNGGTGEMAPITFKAGDVVDIPANTFTRAGYRPADYWKTENGTNYNVGGQIKFHTSTTLYAQWLKNGYLVDYEVNGGTPLKVTTNRFLWDSSNLLPTEETTKDGYTLIGWQLENSDVMVTNATKYSELSLNDTHNSRIKLIAQWSGNNYTVKYETGFGDINIEDKINVKWNDSSLLPETPKKDGYGFIGWELNGKQIESTDKYSDLTADQTDGSFITLTAKWVELTDYSVLYNANGGSMTRRVDATITGMKYQDIVPTPTPVREGYTFLNWTYKEKAVKANSTYASLAQDSSLKQIELVAQWSINKHTVTYEFVTNSPDGIKPPSGVIVEYGSKTAETTVVVPTDWEFDGWYADKECTQKFDFETAINSDITLYGKWAYKGKPTEPVEPSQPNKPSTDNTNSPSVNTGDTTNSVMYVITLMISMLGLLAFAVKKHEKKKVNK